MESTEERTVRRSRDAVGGALHPAINLFRSVGPRRRRRSTAGHDAVGGVLQRWVHDAAGGVLQRSVHTVNLCRVPRGFESRQNLLYFLLSAQT